MRNRHTRRPPPPDGVRRLLAIAVVALFVAVCLGRLLAPETPLFGELLPVAGVTR